MTEFGKVGVVVVTWMETATTLACLDSLLASGYPNLLVVVVDNGTPDDPTQAIRARAPASDVVRLPGNLGFPAAANAGARRAISLGAEYLFFLNNDATIDTSTIPELWRDAQRHPLSVHAPRIVYDQDPGRIWSAGGYIVRPWMKNYHRGEGQPADGSEGAGDVDWASGCALFLPVTAFQRIGAFDEKFFLYLEDVDWCLRAASRGIPTRYVPSAMVRHAVSTTARLHLAPAHIRYYAYRNYYRLAFRHAPIWARPLIAMELGWTLIKIAIRTAAFPSYRRDRHYHARTRCVLDFLRGRWGQAPAAASRS